MSDELRRPDASKFRKFTKIQTHAPTVRVTSAAESERIDISQEIARKQQLENENRAQDIRLKRITLDRLFWFLTAETALIFVFAFCQAISWPAGFELEDWSFRLVVGATIAQITGMLFVAVRYLFPTNNKE
jgi:hypothetical protein